jgi:4-amino-4-deoxy-L-arabinose transferase-like glycosyltransferase
MGKIFLYESGNNPDQILRYSRFPIILLGILLGWLLYWWTKKYYGKKVALLALFFYAMSPTFIAHSRYVTTDTGASIGFFAAIVFFVNYLKHPTNRHLVYAGLALGVAFLLKFSTIILAPIFIVLGLLWVFVNNYSEGVYAPKKYLIILWKIFLVGLIALALVYVFYIYHIWNYPLELQKADTTAILTSLNGQKIAVILNNLSNVTVLRPLTEYLFGVTSVIQRAGGGNSAHFMHTVYSTATPWYFPTLYAVKEHLAFHLLTLVALIFSISKIVKAPVKSFKAITDWIKKYFFTVSFLFFIFVYAVQSITGNLNIGVRHIAPILPFIYILVARQIIAWLGTPVFYQGYTNILSGVKFVFKSIFQKSLKYSFVGVMILWMIFNIIMTAPYYLSYYNELGGGVKDGYSVATDSNYDWGQDMKRLKWWMDENGVPAPGEKIALHYFGGGSAKYYLGADNYEDWWSSKGEPKPGMYFAISANAREGSMATPVRGFTQAANDKYSWLIGKTPIARAGSSIFIYKF